MSDYYLPKETGQRVDASIQRCRNLGLILDKYPPQLVVQKSENKSAWLKDMKPDSHIDEQLAEQVYARWLHAIEATPHALHFDARTDWRMVVGLGGETVLETDLTLHHIYGIPYVPGSALKGLTRAYVTSEVEGHKNASKKLEGDDAEVQRIFGTQKVAGSVIFFDAMPVKADFDISLDIMNSHYPNYYGDKKPPTNDQSPNPITFLTITNATFTFALAPRRSNDPQHKKDVENVQDWLQKALRDYGVGGKTSAGYGTLTVVAQKSEAKPTQQQQSNAKSTPAEPVNPELNTIAGYIRELGYISNKDIPGRIQGFYQRWQKITSDEARVTFAKAIVEKARQGMRERDLANKSWYKELREFLDKANQ